MTRVEIKPTIGADIKVIADRLRKDTMIEMQLVGMDTTKGIRTVVDLSDIAWSGFADGEIACIWGITPGSIITNTGTLWLVTTKLVEKHSFLFLRWSRRFIDELNETKRYSLLHGSVRSDFPRSVWWLKWLGFKIEPPQMGLRYFHWEQPK